MWRGFQSCDIFEARIMMSDSEWLDELTKYMANFFSEIMSV